MSSEPEQRTEMDPEYRAALKRAEELQGFYTHILVYVIVNIGLFIINMVTRDGDDGWWFYWPLIGWGIGVFIHGLTTFFDVFSENWKVKKAEELYARRRQSS